MLDAFAPKRCSYRCAQRQPDVCGFTVHADAAVPDCLRNQPLSVAKKHLLGTLASPNIPNSASVGSCEGDGRDALLGRKILSAGTHDHCRPGEFEAARLQCRPPRQVPSVWALPMP